MYLNPSRRIYVSFLQLNRKLGRQPSKWIYTLPPWLTVTFVGAKPWHHGLSLFSFSLDDLISLCLQEKELHSKYLHLLELKFTVWDFSLFSAFDLQMFETIIVVFSNLNFCKLSWIISWNVYFVYNNNDIMFVKFKCVLIMLLLRKGYL